MKRKRAKAVSKEDFCRIWQESKSVREVAAKTGLKPKACMSRASAYRGQKIPLKVFKAGRPVARPMSTENGALFAKRAVILLASWTL